MSTIKFTQNDVELLRGALNICQVTGVPSLVITNGKIAGAMPSRMIMTLSDAKFSFAEDLKLGIGLTAELLKRLSIFSEIVEIEGVLKDKDFAQLTLKSGRASSQFRCTREGLIKYPKEDPDPYAYKVTISKAEALQLCRAISALSITSFVIKIGRDGQAGFEAIDSNNDKFELNFENNAEFLEESSPTVNTYEASRFSQILNTAAKDAEEVVLLIGQEHGKITMNVKGFGIIINQQVTEDEDDDE